MERAREPEATRRARPATRLRAGVDLGGTKIQAVVVGDRGARVHGAARRDTPTRGGPEAVATEIAQAVRDAASGAGVDPVRT